MPDTLWPLFEANSWLLNGLFALAADNLQYAAELRGLTVGIFGALHTYGRQLNRNCHIHLSVRARWIWNVRQYLLSAWESLTLPPVLAHIRDYDEWQRFILSQGKMSRERFTGMCILRSRRSIQVRRRNIWAGI